VETYVVESFLSPVNDLITLRYVADIRVTEVKLNDRVQTGEASQNAKAF
jgi:hypothetical protein